MNAAVLTVSDGVSAGVRDDRSGDVLAELLGEEGFEVERRVVADDATQIADAIRALADGGARLVLTTGGTGFAPRDVTPEATQDGDRPRGAGSRRGDSGGRDRADSPRAALAWSRRASRRDPRREPARVARWLPRRVRGRAAGAAPRARARRGRHRDRRTAKHERRDGSAPPAAGVARAHRAHGVRTPVRVCRSVPLGRCVAGLREHGLDHGRDGRRSHARDVSQPARGRRARRSQPADGDARASFRCADAGAGARLCAFWHLPSSSSRCSSSTRSSAGSGPSRSRCSSSTRT